MDEPVDLSFYLGENAENIANLDVPLSSGQIVSINLAEELPEDPNELISFLEGENCAKKYWISVATAYAHINKLDEALVIVNHALALQQFQTEQQTFRSFLVWLYLRLAANGSEKESNLNRASAEIARATGEGANTSNVLSQAVLYLLQDHEDKALDIFDRLLKIDQKNCFALLGKAQIVLHKTKNYSHALKLYQQVLILNPLMKPDPRIGIGLCFWFLKDHKMAVQAWERVLELDPGHLKAKVLLNLASFNSSFINSLSDEEFLQNYKACLTQLSKNYKEKPSDFVISLALVSYYFSKQNFDVVEKLINKIVLQITGNGQLKFSNLSTLSAYQANILSQSSSWLGRVAFSKADFTQASKYFQESIKLNDNNLVAKLGLGQSQFNRGSVEEAIITYESILRSNVKCLEVNYSLGLLYSQQKSRRKQEQAIQILERYVKLSNNRGLVSSKEDEGSEFLNREPVALNAYLVLSKLYESRDISQSLTYLNKAIESRKQINQDAPLEVYNNIGVFNFMRQNYEEATVYFQNALDKVKQEFKSEDGDVLVELPTDLKISLTYNLARSKEISLESEAVDIYNTLLEECPHYFSAKLRLLFLDSITGNKLTKQEIKTEIEQLLSLNASDLETRSFYGWFVKNFGKKLGLKPDADTNHQKDTLVEHDSHDCYALISLANIYCVMARDIKASGKEDDKRKKYYIRATELFAKVLSVDPKNVYAAQGLAIAYIENKESNKGLDILRKIRDSLNDISVYLNLGHVLIELKQYGKAIENYEIASQRFTDGEDSKIHSYLGRAWYLRAGNEKNLGYYHRALESAKKALDYATGSHASLKFNVAYVQFQIAEFLTKLPVGQRSVDDIKIAITNLQTAIEVLSELSSDDEKHAPYPKADLKARATLGSSTLLTRLNACLEETVENNSQIAVKLEEAQKLRQEEQDAKLKKQEEELTARKLKEEQLSKERAILQEQAQQWAEESRMNVIVDDDEDEKYDGEGDGEEKTEKKPKKTKKETKKPKKARKKIVDDSEEEEAELSAESDGEPKEAKKNGKRKQIEDDEDDDVKPSSKKSKALSSEFINESDDALDDDLFGENEE